MALIEFGAAKHRKACLERVETALKLAASEFETIRQTQHILNRAAEHGMRFADDDSMLKAYARAHGYLAIAGENVMVGLGKHPTLSLRPFDPPLDPLDPDIETFFSLFYLHNFTRTVVARPSAASAPPKPSEPLHERNGYFALDGNRTIQGIDRSLPEGELADLLEDWTFIPTVGPYDADQREWLAQAIWGIGSSVPDGYIPDDETLIHHARLAVKAHVEALDQDFRALSLERLDVHVE